VEAQNAAQNREPSGENYFGGAKFDLGLGGSRTPERNTHTRAQPFPSPTRLLKYSLCYRVKRSSLRSLPVVAMASSSAFVPKHDVRCGSPGAKRWLPPSFRWSHSLCPIGDAQGYDLNEARMESVFIGISGLIGAGKVRW